MSSFTVFDSSLPDSIILRHKGIISVVSRKVITSCSSVFTKAPEQNMYTKCKEMCYTIISSTYL